MAGAPLALEALPTQVSPNGKYIPGWDAQENEVHFVDLDGKLTPLGIGESMAADEAPRPGLRGFDNGRVMAPIARVVHYDEVQRVLFRHEDGRWERLEGPAPRREYHNADPPLTDEEWTERMGLGTETIVGDASQDGGVRVGESGSWQIYWHAFVWTPADGITELLHPDVPLSATYEHTLVSNNGRFVVGNVRSTPLLYRFTRERGMETVFKAPSGVQLYPVHVSSRGLELVSSGR